LIDGVQTAFLGATSAFPGGDGPGAAAGVVYLLGRAPHNPRRDHPFRHSNCRTLGRRRPGLSTGV
ncbi:hypothetical protein ACWD5W_25235, partial [Streptomyces sp. NPDC002455]